MVTLRNFSTTETTIANAVGSTTGRPPRVPVPAVAPPRPGCGAGRKQRYAVNNGNKKL